MRRKLGWLAVGVGSLAVAGGRDAPTFSAVFREVPGAQKVIETPFEQLGNLSYTHRLTLQGAGPVFLTRAALEGSETPNVITVWVSSPHSTLQQQRALVAVIKYAVARCFAPLTPPQTNMLQTLAQQNWWLKLGQQEQQMDFLKISWSGKEGLKIGGHEVSGIRVEWPNNRGMCTW
ncbi:hypothetical protein ACFFLM_07845 [Deinococcus oregonensis]|uniref:Uncharacterized protein n=1 Tax=Deinococcus oregonensis TaxID=1805970 RepID=A0ABV6AWJ5_9DEIO